MGLRIDVDIVINLTFYKIYALTSTRCIMLSHEEYYLAYCSSTFKLINVFRETYRILTSKVTQLRKHDFRIIIMNELGKHYSIDHQK